MLFRNTSWLYPLRGAAAAWGVGMFLCLLVWSGVAGAQTPAGTRISNVATADYTAGSLTGSITSDTVRVTVGGPAPTGPEQLDYKLTKRAVEPISRKVGEVVQYRLVATNLVNSAINGLRITDTLPALLDFVSASPAPGGIQGPVLSWTINLAPADSAVILINARVNAPVAQRTEVLNTAWATLDTVARKDTATIFVEPAEAAKLEITLAASVLEVAIGQTAGLVATVLNPGPENLDDLVVHVTLPEGTTYVSGSLNGAELISVGGTRLTVRLPGILAALERKAFSYTIAIVNPPSAELVNRATATARAGSVVSNEAIVVLRLLTRMAAQTSVVIGKVWADLNANGRQDEGEAGLAGVDVWTEDGAVARTDSDGKFSFVNLRLGTHVFRPDPTTIPSGYMVARREDGLQRVRLTGWTSPRIAVPLLPAPGPAALALRMAAKQKSPGAAPAPFARLASAPASAPTFRPALPEASGSASDELTVVRIAPAMTPEQRKAEKAKAFLQGPGVEIVSPSDGSVLPTNRAAVIARAERGMPSALMRGDSVLATDVVRIDGLQEFAAIPLAPGPNLLSVQVKNSWGNTSSDRVRVHVSGPVAALAPETNRVVVQADGQTPATVRVQLLDEWGVPVVNRPYVDVTLEGGVILTPDATQSSLGHQVQADPAGWVMLELKGGLAVRRSQLELKTGKLRIALPVEMVARARPMMLIGTGQVGIGASPKSYGALTVRGRVNETTALTVSYDSRRLDDGRNAFNRTSDPLSDGIYPILGDASSMRAMSAARGQISARLERGLDHVSLGDVQTAAIAEDFTLARYARSVTGAAARVSTGPLVWSAFGASSSQSLSQIQIRGRGVSGPYSVGRKIIPGTQQVEVELRDQNNAERVLSRTALLPYIDYEIDPDRGEIMLKRPLPAADGIGNPVFLVVTAESSGGGERKSVWGVRVAGELSNLSGSSRLKGVTVGTSIVRDGQSPQPLSLTGADIRFTPTRSVDLAAEVAHSDVKDSSGLATALRGTVRLLDEALTLAAAWNHVGQGFANPTNTALLGGTTDLSASASLRMGKGEARLEHTRQEFGPIGISRSRTQLSLRQALGFRSELELRMADDDVNGSSDARELGSGEAKLTWAPTGKLKLWGEGRNRLYSRGPAANTTGAAIGGGMSFQAMENVAIEMRHMSIASSEGKESYSLTNLGVRSKLAGGAQAWGSYQLLGGVEGARNAAVIGLNNTLRLNNAVTLSGMFERRMGVERATADDPVRALPFGQQESDYWSAGLGVEILPQSQPYRLSLKGERKNGYEKSALVVAAGDVSLGRSFGVLSRQEFSSRESGILTPGVSTKTDHRASLWGLAWRPRSAERFNTLMELRWARDERPGGGAALDRRGKEERLSAAFEAIWSPSKRLELGSRYAVRRSSSLLSMPGMPEAEQRSDATFLGSRIDLGVARWLGVRGEARAVDERRSRTRTWDVAPSLVLHPVQGIEVTAGRRWGPLNDPDFAANGGRGWFVTASARVTESTLPTSTAFWRNRFTR